jgi:hypothetical protein
MNNHNDGAVKLHKRTTFGEGNILLGLSTREEIFGLARNLQVSVFSAIFDLARILQL